jgi:dipeptidyl-peptidase-4
MIDPHHARPSHWLVTASLLTMAIIAQPPSASAQTSDHPTAAFVGMARSAAPAGSGDTVRLANWQLGARFAPYKFGKLIYSTTVSPRWIEGTEKFWYSWETSAGTFYYIVDPAAASKRQIFDNARIAAELTRITKDPWDAQHLPIRRIRFVDANTLQFDVQSSQDDTTQDVEAERGEQQRQVQGQRARKPRPKKQMFHFTYDVRTQTLSEIPDWKAPDNHPDWASISPDGKTIVYARHDNLYMMTRDDYQKILDARRGKDSTQADSAEWKVEVPETQLTTDGEKDYSYADPDFGKTDEQKAKDEDHRKHASVSWSKDSRRIALVREDQRKSGDLWVIHSTGNKRPELETYKYDMPGEKTVAQSELLVIDLAAKTTVKVKADRFKDQRLGLFDARRFRYPDRDVPQPTLWLADNANQVYFWRRSRDQHSVDVCVADAATGDVKPLIEERLNTYVEHEPLELLKSGDMLWWSERDGWGHIYRYASDGTLKNQITSGPWRTEGIIGVDETRGVVYLSGNARELGEDPYYLHQYRVGLDGSGLTLLDPGDFDHQAGNLRRQAYSGFGGQEGLSPGTRYFVDNYSRVNTVPASVLYDGATGRKVMDLETADFSELLAAGYKFPEPYTVKSADGVTDLSGVLYKPFDFDSTKVYPVIAYVYPGPQTEAVNQSWATRVAETTSFAQFGFIVVTVGNRGGHPSRSKWYHNYGYGNLRDYGLADKKAAIEQLHDLHPYIDLDRVGITGHSGGGFMSTAAMLVYPDFYKVAVSESGNHNNDIYNWNWSEKHNGIKEMHNADSTWFEYNIERNSDLAKNLKGHLMLSTGDIDNNVHPANTLRMAEALIKANKRFDFFILPGQRHGYGNMSDYWYWVRSEYFIRWLMGDARYPGVDIEQLNVEKEQTK